MLTFELGGASGTESTGCLTHLALVMGDSQQEDKAQPGDEEVSPKWLGIPQDPNGPWLPAALSFLGSEGFVEGQAVQALSQGKGEAEGAEL